MCFYKIGQRLRISKGVDVDDKSCLRPYKAEAEKYGCCEKKDGLRH
jgi:hypothetical protein